VRQRLLTISSTRVAYITVILTKLKPWLSCALGGGYVLILKECDIACSYNYGIDRIPVVSNF
jgi:hypothetical protein